jgi:hypothetical protein
MIEGLKMLLNLEDEGGVAPLSELDETAVIVERWLRLPMILI